MASPELVPGSRDSEPFLPSQSPQSGARWGLGGHLGDQALGSGPEELHGEGGAQGRWALHPRVRTLPHGHI